MSRMSVPVHVEVCVLVTCAVEDARIKEETLNLLAGGRYILRDGPVDFASSALLSKSVRSVAIVDMDDSLPSGVSFWQGDLRVHIYRLSQEGPEQEMIDGAGEEEEIAACEQWVLPSARLEGVWESLVLEEGVKNHLLEYATTALLFTDKRVSKNVISWNRVVLLHGPPGTGKTSLCKALAHKLSIRLGDRYSSGQLLEINAHSLFSKWFSESGKLVQKLFEHILELADDEDSLVCVLVDEVESLTAARSAAMGGNEPSDAVRVVNAVLTQIDNLRERDNVLILTTSNVSEAIDLAFVDRADIKQFIGLPTAAARYEVLHSCVEELVRVCIILPPFMLPRSFSKATELLANQHGTPRSHRPPVISERHGAAASGAGAAAGTHEVGSTAAQEGNGHPSSSAQAAATTTTTTTTRAPTATTPVATSAAASTSSSSNDRAGGRTSGDDAGYGDSGNDDGMDTSEDKPGRVALSSNLLGGSASSGGSPDCRAGIGMWPSPSPGGRGGLVSAVGSLLEIAELAEGLSGRALRKLPFQAHAFYVQRQTCSLAEFLNAMKRAVRKELDDRHALEHR